MKSALFMILALSSCATQTVKFKAKEAAEIRLLDKNGYVSDTVLGTTPVVLNQDKLVGKGVQIQSPRRKPQVWYFLPADVHELEIAVELERDETYIDKEKERAKEKEAEKSKDKDAQDKAESTAQKNKLLRTIMASYQALFQEEPQEALRLANEAIVTQPDVAAPEILKGLALVKLKKWESAKQAFRRAKVLDPQDPNIDVLIKSLED